MILIKPSSSLLPSALIGSKLQNTVKLVIALIVVYKLCDYYNGDGLVDSSLLTNRDDDNEESGRSSSSGGNNNLGMGKSRNKRRALPSVLIIGARKCGTRALIDMLNLHPQVEKAQLEVHFFDRDENYEKGLEWYESQMPEISPDSQISIEKSPSYFVTPEVPERVYGMNSTIKLLLIVREPVTRVVSDYSQIYYYSNSSNNNNPSVKNNTKTGAAAPPPVQPNPPPPPPPPLSTLILHPDGSINTNYKAIRISIYSRYLQRWLDIFPTAQIHVIDGDALIRDPFTQLQEVEKFLNLEGRLKREDFYFNSTKGFYCWKKREVQQSEGGVGSNGTGNNNYNESSSQTGGYSNTVHCLNDSKGRKHPNVDRRIVRKLREFYKPFNQRFYDMIGRDFGWPES